jgi:FdhD protein
VSDSSLYQVRNILKYDQGKWEQGEQPVVCEAPLKIIVNGIEVTTLICSPRGYEELAVGFLLTQGLIKKMSEITHVVSDIKDGVICVKITVSDNRFFCASSRQNDEKTWAGINFAYNTSELEPVKNSVQFSAESMLHMIELLEEKSQVFRVTGAVHNVALGDGRDLLVMYEDIGRHNAVDKVLGHALLKGINTSDKCLVLSGRVASEILVKAARGKVPLVLSRSAPMKLAIDLAEELGITIIGFARGKRFGVYSHAERIVM